MKLRLIAVGLEGPVNLGYLGRLAENFDVDELYLVSPIASIPESLRWAAKASEEPLNARVVGSLKDALEGAELKICTSDEASAKDLLRVPVTPEEAAEVAASHAGTVAVVLGRESVGLTREELAMCDMLVTIPASEKYTALNVSNAAAIVLYEIYKASRKPQPAREPPDPKTVLLVEAYSRALAYAVRAPPEATQLAFRKLLAKSSAAETRAVLSLLSKACAALGCKDLFSEEASKLGIGSA